MSGRIVIQKEVSGSANTRSGSDPRTEFDISSAYQNALALHRQNRFDEAETLYRQVLASNPNHPGATHFLGMVFFARKNHPEALDLIMRSIELCDTKAVYYNNYGVALRELGKLPESQAAFETATRLHKDYADAWANLGAVLYIQKNSLKKAEKALKNALVLQPDHPVAQLNLADLYCETKRNEEGIPLYRKCLERTPDDVTILKKLGHSLARRQLFNESIEVLQKATCLNPHDVELQYSLGMIQCDFGRFEEAKGSFARAVLMVPHKTFWKWKPLGFCPTVFENVDAIDEYWTKLDKQLDIAMSEKHRIDWRDIIQDGVIPSFQLPHHNRCCREIKEKFAALYREIFPKYAPPIKRTGGRIHIGFLVNKGHERGFLRVYEGILKRINLDRFRLSVICDEAIKPVMEKAISRDGVEYVAFPPDFGRAVEMIRAARCDIVTYWKVGGDVWNYFLAVARVAPVQCTSYGTHGTSGVASVDHYISSALIESEKAAEHYTEKLHLLKTFATHHPRSITNHEMTKSDFGIPENGALYLSPHRLSKYHPVFDEYLKGILERDGNGRVVILSGSEPYALGILQKRMMSNLGELLYRRCHFLPPQPVSRYYPLVKLATVVLDSPVYAGDLTSHDAFSFGIPVVTQTGPLLVQRYPSGLYAQMNMSDMISRNQSEYVGQAVRLGSDPDYHHERSKQIMERSSSIFDDKNTISEYEMFFEKVALTY